MPICKRWLTLCLLAPLFLLSTIASVADRAYAHTVSNPLPAQPQKLAGSLPLTRIREFVNAHCKPGSVAHKEWMHLLTSIKPQQAILDRIQKPAEALPWWRYRRIVLTPDRVEKGLLFWKSHRDTLERAQTEFGVPPEIVVAILGVESHYGQRMKGFPVLDALVTLAFYGHNRPQFFAKELRSFLELARKEQWDIRTVQGSYAGAMGMPQFMPSSYQSLAVDYNRDGKTDLFHQPDDAIGSVAHYLQKNGWKRGEPLVFPVQLKEAAAALNPTVGSKIPKPDKAIAWWLQHGVSLRFPLQFESPELGKLAIAPYKPDMVGRIPAQYIRLSNQTEESHWLILPNFYTITRYNISTLYAMAVTELSAHLRAGWDHANAEVHAKK